MARRFLAAGVILLEAVLLLLVLGVAGFALGGATAPTMTLSIFSGTATVQRSGTATAVAAQTGEALGSGDTVVTSATGRAAINYPDGSITRLDTGTTVKVSARRAGDGALQASFEQSAGLTWNRVQRLVGLATFKVSGPNSATADVRGTTFGYYVEHDPAGKPVIWIDTYAGTVLVGGTGPPVLAGAGTRVTVRAGAAPTQPVPIPAGDRQLSFTVFNQALDALAGTPISFATGTLSAGGGSQSFSVRADGQSELQFVLAWPGSTFELTVVDPAGNLYSHPSSPAPVLSVVAPRARAGVWTFSVRDLESATPENWWVVVGRR